MKILIISYYFLPSTIANAKRPFYITKGLLDKGWDVDVITSDSNTLPDYTEQLTHQNLTITRIRDPYYTAEISLTGKLKKIILAFLKGFILWPDNYVLWALKILRKTDTKKYDRVFVCIMPISMIVFSLFKKVSSKWIFDYSEPFSLKTVKRRRSPILFIMSPFMMRLQRRMLKRSGAALFTSNTALQDYVDCGLIAKEKSFLVPLFFNDSDYSNKEPDKDLCIISYTGVFGMGVEKRSPATFFQALHLFLEKTPEARKKIKFHFYGQWQERDTPLISKYNLEDIVAINPAVPHEHYLNVLETSSILLLVTDESDNMFIPSKMLDYFGAKRPILAFVPSNSETYSILKDAGMHTFHSEPYDAKQGFENIEALWNKWIRENLSCKNTTTNHWSFSFQMPRILEIVNKK